MRIIVEILSTQLTIVSFHFHFQPHSGFTGRIGLIYSTRTTLPVPVSRSFGFAIIFVHRNVQKLTHSSLVV